MPSNLSALSILGRTLILIIKIVCLIFVLSFSMLLFKDGLLLKLSDFGTAKKLEHTLTNAVGTIRYMAPEVIRGTCTALLEPSNIV